MDKFGDNLRRIRKEKQLSMDALADLAGTSKQVLSRYENNQRAPKISMVKKLADALNVSVAELSGESDAEQRLDYIREKLITPFTSPEWKQLSNNIEKLSDARRHMPQYELAAIRATETLIKYRVAYAPISPLPILKAMPGVVVITFSEIAALTRLERSNIIELTGAVTKHAITLVQEFNKQLRYIVAYNMSAPFYILQYAMARELAHIVMAHDGSKDDDIRAAESECFANYLLFPRQLLRAASDAGIPLTVGNIGRALGCYEQCIETVRNTPGIMIPPQLNVIVRSQFTEYVQNYIEMQEVFKLIDNTPLADLGSYMDSYAE